MQRSPPTPKEAESAYTKATKAEIAKDFDSAFQNYFKSADLFLHLSRTNVGDERKKEKWKNDASRALQRAEKIKHFIDRSNEARQPPTAGASTKEELASQQQTHLTPVSIDPFSAQQQSAQLKKGGTANGLSLPLWEEGSDCSISNPRLSPVQQEMSAVWRAPSEAECSFSMSSVILPHDISQNVIADCSVCASIAVCLEHARRFGTNLAGSILHPRSETVYDLKIFYNGAWRKVVKSESLSYCGVFPDSHVLLDW
ncbi:cysteine protease [Marasmius tenuissimus]|uniref:Cysteine protease n=1 Tax=Marasmius tenuissimus TaxID=585030 RepID=A0ABR3AF12_9AGAR